MSNSNLKNKLKKASFMALFEEKKYTEAIDEYYEYIKILSKGFFKSKEKKEEIEKTSRQFLEKLKKVASECFDKEEYNNAIKCYENIFALDPKDKGSLNKYIKALEKIEAFDLAADVTKKLIEVDPNKNNYKLCAQMLSKNKEYHEAIKYYEEFVKLGRRDWNDLDYCTVGCYYHHYASQNHNAPKEARLAFKNFIKALKLNPSESNIRNAYIAAKTVKRGRLELALWKKYHELGYIKDKDDEFRLSAAAMRNGDIKTWEEYYDVRFVKEIPHVYKKLSKKPIWNGEDVSTKTLLVLNEQGYGDTITMFGYVPRLVNLPKKLIFVVQDPLYELLKNNNYGAHIISDKNLNLDEINYDLNIGSMSLPKALKLTKENLGHPKPYIEASRKLVREYQEKYFNTRKLKVGFAFKGADDNVMRNIPIESLKLLEKLKNVQLYCLNVEIPEGTFDCFKKSKVIDLGPTFKDYNHTAAAIANCDIIVSSDCCVLNLAGAMGKRTIGLFRYQYEFRWFDLNKEDCGWYKSVKPIINNAYDDWSKSMEKAIKEVEKFQKSKL